MMSAESISSERPVLKFTVLYFFSLSLGFLQTLWLSVEYKDEQQLTVPD